MPLPSLFTRRHAAWREQPPLDDQVATAQRLDHRRLRDRVVHRPAAHVHILVYLAIAFPCDSMLRFNGLVPGHFSFVSRASIHIIIC